jgi:hypothetical protein
MALSLRDLSTKLADDSIQHRTLDTKTYQGLKRQGLCIRPRLDRALGAANRRSEAYTMPTKAINTSM